MMELDKNRKLFERMNKQAKKRALPKQRREYAAWLDHAKQCPNCVHAYNAKMREQEALAVERRKSQMPDPKQVMQGLFSNLGLTSTKYH